MIEIVNLRQARKLRERAAAEAKAAENRARFGVTKREREAGKADRETSARRLEGHRRENGGDGDA